MTTLRIVNALAVGTFIAACAPWQTKQEMDDTKTWIGWDETPPNEFNPAEDLNVRQFQDSVKLAICLLERKVNELLKTKHTDLAAMTEPDLLCHEQPGSEHNDPPPVPPFE